MTTKSERELLLQGKDLMANAIVAHMLAQGWECDCILKNAVTKQVGPRHASIWVEFDSENQQYWLKGEYTSAGEDVLSTCFCHIKVTSSPEEITKEMARLLTDVDARLSQSFAARFLCR